MKVRNYSLVASLLVLGGCATGSYNSIPVVDAASSASELEQPARRSAYPPATAAQAGPDDSGVVVLVPQGAAARPTVQSLPAPGPYGSIISTPIDTGSMPESAPAYGAPGAGPGVSPYAAPGVSPYAAPTVPSAPTGIPSSGGLAADEQLDGPVLALLNTAQQQQGGGDLNGAASSLERAQRIAPREPQVLYRLAEVRLAQGDAAQAEQFARRGLSYATGRPALQASLWELIAQSRERQGDAAGAAQARQNARVNL
jgi:predicted Zn-dependent protease